MDLKSGGLFVLLALVGLFAVVIAQGSFDGNLPQDIEEVELYITPDLEDQSTATGTLPIKDVCVVSADKSTAFAAFVDIAIESFMLARGEVTYKVPSGDMETIKDPVKYEHTKVVANSPSSPITNDIIAVMAKGDAQYTMLVIVESGADPVRNVPEILTSLILETKSRINFLIMDNQGSRGKRAFSASSIYQQIATASGGMVITATKNNIGQVANLLKQSVKANVVDIMRFDFTKPAGQKFSIPVDETMTELTVQIQTGSALPLAMITGGAGLPVSPKNHATPLGSQLMLYEFNITKPTDFGQWKYTKLAGGDWDVKVTGQSPVDFTYAFMEPGPGGVGSYPIKGRPIAGKKYQIKVTVPQYDKLKTIAAVMLLDNHSMPVMPHGVISLKNVGGRRGKSMFTGDVIMPTVTFKVALESMDNKMRQARRLDPFLVTPISIKLIVHAVSVTKLKVNESIDLDFSVVNEASTKQSILVKIEDDHKFAQSPVNLFYSDVKANEIKNGTFKIHAGTLSGITDTVTITAKPYIKGQQTQGQFEIRRFTVEDIKKNKTDTINPTCNITKSSGQCSIGSDLCACVNHTWSIDVVVGDEGFGLQSIFPVGAGNNNSFTFKHDTFTVGHNISQGAIKASLRADCCHQLASIQVEDKAGNTAQCSSNFPANFTAPNPNICNHTNVNLTVTCKSITSAGQCKIGSDPCDCGTKSWHVTAEFDKTNNQKLTHVSTIGAGNNATLVQNGQVVDIDLDCCQQNITVVGEDFAGNIGECNISLGNNFVPPKPSDCTTTTSSTATTSIPSSASNSKGSSQTSGTSGVTNPPGKSSSNSGSTNPASSGLGTNGPGSSTAIKNSGSTGGSNTNTPGSGSQQSKGTQQPGQTNPPGTTGNSQSKTAKSTGSDESKSGVPESAVAAGMTIGTIGAVSAVAVMAVLFRRISKQAAKGVTPSADSRRDSAWS